MSNRKLFAARFIQLIAGLIAFGVGIGLMIRASLGISPWDVLAQGLSFATGLAFGVTSVIVSCLVLLLWIPLRQKPGIGTILNALLIGPVAEATIFLVPETQSLPLRAALLISGIVIIALGTGMYIGASFGPGPRDGLMTGLNFVTGMPIWVARTGIELTALFGGWLLGGNVGIGTVVFAVLIGPLAQPAMKWFDMSDKIIVAKKQLPENNS